MKYKLVCLMLGSSMFAGCGEEQKEEEGASLSLTANDLSPPATSEMAQISQNDIEEEIEDLYSELAANEKQDDDSKALFRAKSTTLQGSSWTGLTGSV